jgi:3-oxoacyl-[acyl-carrier protein] reductase
MSEPLAERVALVTGGSRGIGRAIAASLVRAGARVVLTARTSEAAERAAAEIEAPQERVRGVALDVSSDEQVARVVAGLLDDYARIAILVNNAGVTSDNLLLRMKPEEWSRVVDTNLTGVYRMCRAVVPSMVRARFGRIVNITSVVAEIGNAGQTNYAAAKAGIQGFTRSLAREIASRNITVNCIAPGFIDTDMTRGLDESVRSQLLEQVPAKRLGQPEDVAAAVVFLAGEDAGYITGTTLHVNGGMYM